jgi:hypothetical protein
MNVTSPARATIVTPDTATWRVSLAVTLAGCLARNASLLAPSEATDSLYPALVACPKAVDRLPIKWNMPHQGACRLGH